MYFLEPEEDLSTCWEEFQELVDGFNESFQSNVDSIEERHFNERSELVKLRKNYKRLLVQKAAASEKHVEEVLEKDRKKCVNKLLKKKDRERFERILKNQEYFALSEKPKRIQVVERKTSS